MKVPGCVLETEDASSADLRETEQLKIPEVVAGGKHMETCKLKVLLFSLERFQLKAYKYITAGESKCVSLFGTI